MQLTIKELEAILFDHSIPLDEQQIDNILREIAILTARELDSQWLESVGHAGFGEGGK